MILSLTSSIHILMLMLLDCHAHVIMIAYAYIGCQDKHVDNYFKHHSSIVVEGFPINLCHNLPLARCLCFFMFVIFGVA